MNESAQAVARALNQAILRRPVIRVAVAGQPAQSARAGKERAL